MIVNTKIRMTKTNYRDVINLGNLVNMFKIKNSKRFKKIDLKKLQAHIPKKSEIFYMLSKLKIQIMKLNLKIKLGTESAPITSYLVVTIATIISIILPKLVKNNNNKKIKYIVTPIYNNKDIRIKLNCIISLKIVHIIYVIYMLEKKGREKNGRTSNRRAYAYSHEFN